MRVRITADDMTLIGKGDSRRCGHSRPLPGCGPAEGACSDRVGGYSGQVQSSGAVLDEDQCIQPFEQHRLEQQEVTRGDRVGVSCQELSPGRPGPARRRIDTSPVEHLPHRGGRNRASKACQVALDCPVPSGRVLPCHPHNQCLERPAGSGPPRALPVSEGPLTRHEVTMPAQDRRRDDGEGFRPPAAGGRLDNAAGRSRSA